MEDQVLNFISEKQLSESQVVFYSFRFGVQTSENMLSLMDAYDIEELLSMDTVQVSRYDFNHRTHKLHVFVDIFSLDDIEDDALSVVYTTTDPSGYPSHTKEALIGFDNWEEVQQLLSEYPFLSAVELTKKDGHAYYRMGIERDTDFSATEQLSYRSEDWQEFMALEDKIALHERIRGMTDDLDIDELKEQYEDRLYQHNKLSRGQLLAYSESDKEQEILSNCMSFTEDTITHTIGLVIA